jgi:hypothetical protein
MKRACFTKSTNLHEQNQHVSSIRPLRNIFIRMKKCVIFSIMIFLFSGGFSLLQLAAQEKTKDELEKEINIQKAINDQKKAMAEQKRLQDELRETLKHELNSDSIIKEIRVEVNSDLDREGVRIYNQRGRRSFEFDDPFVFSPSPDESFLRHSVGGNSERTTWEFSKSVKENTFTKHYTFDVEKTVRTAVMSVMGDCKTGEIRIKIIMPNGKSYSDILIDESGNLNWRKSFSISETENQDKAGEWKFEISSTKATGYFKISLQTY